MRRKLTLSKIEHAEACLYSFRPDIETPHDTSTNPAMDLGNEVHAMIAGYIGGQPVTGSPEACMMFEQWLDGYTDLSGIALAEVAIAYDQGEVILLGFDTNRDYTKAPPTAICGSVDAVCMRDGMLYVYEWKTGAQRNLTRFQNPQARAYGALIAKLLGTNEVTCVTVVIDNDGTKEYVDHIIDFQPILSHITSLADEAESFQPPPMPGSHCSEKYCVLRATCPGVVQTTAEMMRPVPVPLATISDVGNTIEKLFAMKAQYDAIWELVDKRVDELGEDIPLSNGKTYGWKEQNVDSITYDDAAVQIIAKHGLKPAVKTSLTKKSLEEAVAEIAPPRGKAKLMRLVTSELEDFGSLEKRPRRFLGVK